MNPFPTASASPSKPAAATKANSGRSGSPSATTANPALTGLAQYIEPHIGEKNWARAFRSPLFAVKQGSGQVVVCDLRISAAGSDPIARRLLANLLPWMSRP